MWRKRINLWIGLLMIVAIAAPPGGVRAGGGEILHSQTDQGGGLPVSSTNFSGALEAQDNQVADDFTLTCPTSCQIDTIYLTGSYQGSNPGLQPSQVMVQFFADPETGIPGDLIFDYFIPYANVGGID